jgi:hypothetical protein
VSVVETPGVVVIVWTVTGSPRVSWKSVVSDNVQVAVEETSTVPL